MVPPTGSSVVVVDMSIRNAKPAPLNLGGGRVMYAECRHRGRDRCPTSGRRGDRLHLDQSYEALASQRKNYTTDEAKTTKGRRANRTQQSVSQIIAA